MCNNKSVDVLYYAGLCNSFYDVISLTSDKVSKLHLTFQCEQPTSFILRSETNISRVSPSTLSSVYYMNNVQFRSSVTIYVGY